MIEDIKIILKDHLDYVYCFNCKYSHNPEDCDECHRKYMKWALSDEWAQTIAEKIIELMEK